MASLFDKISQNLSAQPQASGPQVGQSQIADVLRAKGGRVQAGGSTPTASSLTADTAAQQAQSQLQQQSFQGAMAGAQLKEQAAQQAAQQKLGQKGVESQTRIARGDMQAVDQIASANRQAEEERARASRSAEENMKLDAMEAGMVNQLRSLETRREVALDDIFAEFNQSNESLELRKDQAELEQLGFQLALSDRSYLDTLDRIGREQRLSSDLQFQEESIRLILGEDFQEYLQTSNFERAFNGTKRDWERQLAEINLDDALDMARASMRESQNRQMAEGLGNLMTAGGQFGAQQGWFGEDAQLSEQRRQYDTYQTSVKPGTP